MVLRIASRGIFSVFFYPSAAAQRASDHAERLLQIMCNCKKTFTLVSLLDDDNSAKVPEEEFI